VPRLDTYVLLLRGINLGGRNRLPMADLRAVAAGLGLGDARTHLQSGNLVCTGSGAAAAVGDALSAAIRTDLSLTVPVVARTAGEWAALLERNPFLGEGEDPARLYVTALAGEPDPVRAAEFDAASGGFAPDRVAVAGADVYLCLAGRYSETVLQNGRIERDLGQVATTRNWRTVAALADLAGVSRPAGPAGSG